MIKKKLCKNDDEELTRIQMSNLRRNKCKNVANI